MTKKVFKVEFDGVDQYENVDTGREGIIFVTKLKGLRTMKITLDGWDATWIARQIEPIKKDGYGSIILECPEINGTGEAIMHKEYIEGNLKYFYSNIYVKEKFELLKLSRLK
ncbi:hypothetical protein [Endozoicomonas sp.]|uniref:hypothetical protein n=1 Tax=Endozoicomonas sp. TaxID=1892382 RepID=UPI0028852493|nr:hypothetical protein [Endozoicomonas sp.]